MTPTPSLRTLSDDALRSLDIQPPGAVNLRRDLFVFVRYVREKGILRTRRENHIPKAAARQLAKLLSWERERECVETDGYGQWSERVSEIARHLGIVSYDTEGEYAGYSSVSPSYADNTIEIDHQCLEAYMGKTGLEKEHALLSALIEMHGNEFFHWPALFPRAARFDSFGSVTGPAGKMNLRSVRTELLTFLASLKPDVWYDMHDIIALLKERDPHLILDPSNRGPNDESARKLREWEWKSHSWGRAKSSKTDKTKKPEIVLEDIYRNFWERAPDSSPFSARETRPIHSSEKEGFMRVEGRYLAYFLRDIPYTMGFVGLAQRSADDPHGLDVIPPFDRLRGFCLTPRFFQIMGRDPTVNQVKTTVLPTFEVLVESPSFPEATLEVLSSMADYVKEEGPIHQLKLNRQKIVARAAADPLALPAAEVLDKLAFVPLPQNVRAEVSLWSGKGEQVVFYEEAGLLEIADEVIGEKEAILKDLGGLVLKREMRRFAVLRNPEAAAQILETGCRVPSRIQHGKSAFASCTGPLGRRSTPKDSISPDLPKLKSAARTRAQIDTEDLVGYRISDKSLLCALQEALGKEPDLPVYVVESLLIFPAAALPAARRALKQLSKQFDITVR